MDGDESSLSLFDSLSLWKRTADEQYHSTCDDNFTKGFYWSPDGSCIVSNSNDNILRLFEVDARDVSDTQYLAPCIAVHDGGSVYDCDWFPLMRSEVPASCCFLCTSTGHPIHLRDGYSGKVRATYAPYDQNDEPCTSYAVAFSKDGERVISGDRRYIRTFCTSRPGKTMLSRLVAPHRGGRRGAFISCLGCNQHAMDLVTAGSYAGHIFLWDVRESRASMIIDGHRSGVTQVLWEPQDGWVLFAGGRRDHRVLAWDVRLTQRGPLRTMKRHCPTNQHMYFDVDANGRYLITGTRDRHAVVFDLRDGGSETRVGHHKGVVNCARFHPCGMHNTPSLGMCTGERMTRSIMYHEDDEDEDDENDSGKEDDDVPQNTSILSLYCTRK